MTGGRISVLGRIERIEEGERNLGVIDSDDFMLFFVVLA